MENIIYTLVPVFMLISIGYIFKRVSFPSLDFWPMMDRFTYYVLFPSLLVYKLSTANLSGVNSFSIVAIVIISLVLMLLITLFIGYFRKIEKRAFTSVIQGAIRFNTYVFLALVDALLGDIGLIIAVVIITFAIVFINFLCIASFSYYINTENLKPFKFVKSIVTNPLILGCFVGGFLNLTALSLPVVVLNTVTILSAAALPMGLLSVGVGLELSHISSAKYELFLATILKLLIFPVVIFCVAYFFNISKEALVVLVLFASMPTASSSTILARQLGGDLTLISSIITLQTLFSIATIAAIVSLV